MTAHTDARPVTPDNTGGLASRMVTGLFWMVLDSGGSQILSFLVYAILTRLLRPSDFGTFALALAITTIAGIPLQGVGTALIQAEAPDADDLSTAFWVNLGLGAGLAGGVFAAAPWFAAAFGTPMLGIALRGMAVILVFRALSSIHSALCQRALTMSVFAARTAAGYAIGGGVAIGLALLGWGVAALVMFQVVQAAVVVMAMWWSVHWRPHLRFSRAALRRLRRFSAHVVAAQLLVTCAEKTDGLAIGLLLNVTALGYYDLALKLIQGIALLAMAPFQAVAMPVLSRLTQDRAAFGQSFTHLVTASSAIWTPAACCLAVAAPTLVPLAFGEHWRGAVPVLQAMCVGCAVVPVWGLTGGALAAAGRSDLYVWVAAAQLGIAAVSFGFAAQFGIAAAGWAWVAVSLLVLPVHLITLRRATGVRVGTLMANVARVAVSGLLMAVVMAMFRHVGGAGPWATGAGVLTGATVYLGSVQLVTLPGYVSEILRLAWQAVPASRQGMPRPGRRTPAIIEFRRPR